MKNTDLNYGTKLFLFLFLSVFSFNNAFSQVNCARKMVLGELAFLAHVDENKFVPAIHSAFDRIHVGLAHACLSVVHNLQKTRRVLVSHQNLPKENASDNILSSCAGSGRTGCGMRVEFSALRTNPRIFVVERLLI